MKWQKIDKIISKTISIINRMISTISSTINNSIISHSTISNSIISLITTTIITTMLLTNISNLRTIAKALLLLH
nr:hypothetical protein [uncultured Ruminococcus sp.]